MATTAPLPLILVDSNVLIYFVDPRDAAKHLQAVAVLDHVIRAERAALSAQCLSEFYRVSTQRLPERLAPAVALVQVERWAAVCSVFDLTPQAVVEACRRSANHQMAIWDALIWAVAKANGVSLILTEDQPGQQPIEGVRYVNPFAPSFDVSQLLTGAT